VLRQVVAAMAALTDVVVRIRATDFPSMFSQHMEGSAPVTAAFEQQAFGLDVTAFIVATEDMLLLAPEHRRAVYLLYWCKSTNILTPEDLCAARAGRAF